MCEQRLHEGVEVGDDLGTIVRLSRLAGDHALALNRIFVQTDDIEEVMLEFVQLVCEESVLIDDGGVL